MADDISGPAQDRADPSISQGPNVLVWSYTNFLDKSATQSVFR